MFSFCFDRIVFSYTFHFLIYLQKNILRLYCLNNKTLTYFLNK